jgi:ferredoxin
MSRIQLDRERCEGHGTCEQIAPNIYQLDDEGLVSILVDQPLSEELVGAAEAGARVCPIAALRVVDGA